MDEPLPLSQLAERCSCVRSNITQLVDRLEADGWSSGSPIRRPALHAGRADDLGRERHAEAVRVGGRHRAAGLRRAGRDGPEGADRPARTAAAKKT